jgi:hypothetical protein
MTVQRKSIVTMIAILTVVSGWYATVVARAADGAAVGDIAYHGHLIVAVVVLVIAAAVAHAIIATTGHDKIRDADTPDLRLRLRRRRVGGAVLAAGSVTGVGLAMVDAPTFWIAHALLAGLVLAEIAAGVTSLMASGRRPPRRYAPSPTTT